LPEAPAFLATIVSDNQGLTAAIGKSPVFGYLFPCRPDSCCFFGMRIPGSEQDIPAGKFNSCLFPE
jgi:hypothetical protein